MTRALNRSDLHRPGCAVTCVYQTHQPETRCPPTAPRGGVCSTREPRDGCGRLTVSSSPPTPSGLERDKFDNKTVSFEEHIKFEHNMWNYLYFIVLVRVKNKTDYTGPESYVAQMIKVWPWRRATMATGVGQLGTLVGRLERPLSSPAQAQLSGKCPQETRQPQRTCMGFPRPVGARY